MARSLAKNEDEFNWEFGYPILKQTQMVEPPTQIEWLVGGGRGFQCAFRWLFLVVDPDN